MKRTALILGLISCFILIAFAEPPLPIRTEIFQEVSLDDVEALPPGVTNLQSIKVDPVSDTEVKYHIKFDTATLVDTVPLSSRYAYQDLQRVHVFDFYNCYSAGKMDGIAIRRDPVKAVDTKMFKSRDGQTFVLRVVFYCGDGASSSVTSDKSSVSISFTGSKRDEATVARTDEEPVKKKEPGTKVVRVHKNVLYGIGLTALIGATATYFVGHNTGEEQGKEDAYNNPINHLPSIDDIPDFPPEP